MTPRPLHRRGGSVALVLVGGTAGTAVREGASILFPSAGGFPLTIFAVNLLGSFLLGMLLESLVRAGDDAGRRRVLRLRLGTGVLGGFTPYSTLATETGLLLGAGQTPVAIIYAVATVVLGAGTAALGIVLAATVHRRSAR